MRAAENPSEEVVAPEGAESDEGAFLMFVTAKNLRMAAEHMMSFNDGAPHAAVMKLISQGLSYCTANGYFRQQLEFAEAAAKLGWLKDVVTVEDPATGAPTLRRLDYAQPGDLQLAWDAYCDLQEAELREYKRELVERRKAAPRFACRTYEEAFARLLAGKDPAELARTVVQALLDVRRAAVTPFEKESAARDLALFSLSFVCGFRTLTYCDLRVPGDVRVPADGEPVQFDFSRFRLKNANSPLVENGIRLKVPRPPAGAEDAFSPDRAIRDYICVWRPQALQRMGPKWGQGAVKEWRDRLFLPLQYTKEQDGKKGMGPNTLYARVRLITAHLVVELAPFGFAPQNIRELCAVTLYLSGRPKEARYILLDTPAVTANSYLPRFFGLRHEALLQDVNARLYGTRPSAADRARLAALRAGQAA